MPYSLVADSPVIERWTLNFTYLTSPLSSSFFAPLSSLFFSPHLRPRSPTTREAAAAAAASKTLAEQSRNRKLHYTRAPLDLHFPLLKSTQAVHDLLDSSSWFTDNMGGKTWSREEELYFWRTIVPISPKAASLIGKAVDWEQSALMMHKNFGKKARRNYTKLMLCAHI